MSDYWMRDGDGGNAPDIDEGWWAAILADEPSIYSEIQEVNCKPCGNHLLDGVDWDCVTRVFEHDEVVLLEVTGFNRGGLLVQREGIQGFVPSSHLIEQISELGEEEKQTCLAGYVGKSLYVKVIECDPSAERVVLSERAAQAGEGKRKELFDSLTVGTIVCWHRNEHYGFWGFH